MVRLVKLWLGVHPLANAQAPPRSRRQQVHLVRLHLQRLRLHPQPHRQAREVIPGCSLPLDDTIWGLVGPARGIFETRGGELRDLMWKRVKSVQGNFETRAQAGFAP